MYRRSAVVLIVAVLALSGCSSYFDSQDGYQPSPEPVQAEGENSADQQPTESEARGGWLCIWDPTYNDDWHDDYVCSNGTSIDRPDLLPDDPFVESEELDAAAAAYEDSLNR
ncbi:hypothetical protein [Salinibacterium sp. SWN1162]|uniref:hypothetical protein n=1 Tax=Salinibacterium sp. SWN1162 TaxID=2792053 RepID=UPI0018CEC3A8|nr:hypothetical protein [Salinibacterium sp. SWN1162]MBH0010193.1 hypothetical protein [Salinibacterium sp. SWN1162]